MDVNGVYKPTYNWGGHHLIGGYGAHGKSHFFKHPAGATSVWDLLSASPGNVARPGSRNWGDLPNKIRDVRTYM